MANVVTASDLQTLFIDWWNFPSAMPDVSWGHAVGLEQVTTYQATLDERLSVPFLSGLIKTTASHAPVDVDSPSKYASELGPTFLDQHLLAKSTPQALAEFEKTLMDADSGFIASFSSGKSMQGSLADLCAVRLSGIIMRRPSPIFFNENYPEMVEAVEVGSYVVSTPHLWLPTHTGQTMRGKLLGGELRFGVPLFLYFLSGNYLPESHGFTAPLSMAPDQWEQASRASRGVHDIIPRNTARTSGRGPGCKPLNEPVRLALLASIFLARQAQDYIPQALRRPLTAVSHLSLPWKGNKFLTSADQKKFLPVRTTAKSGATQ